MPLMPTAEAGKSDVSGYQKVLDAIKEHREELFQVGIDASKGGDKGGRFGGTDLDFNVIAADEVREDGVHDETPEEITQHIWGLAEGFDAEAGMSHRFRARLILRDEKGNTHTGPAPTFYVGDQEPMPGFNTGQGPVRDEAVALLQHQNRVINAQDRIIMSAHKFSQQQSETIATLAGPIAQAQVDIAKVNFEREDREYEHRERMGFQQGGFEFLKELAGPLGSEIASAHADWKAKQKPKAPPADPDGTALRDRWRAIMAKLDDAQRKALEKAFGKDLASVASAMAEATDDGAFRNQAKKFSQTWKARKDASDLLKKIGEILGKELADEFGAVISEAQG